MVLASAAHIHRVQCGKVQWRNLTDYLSQVARSTSTAINHIDCMYPSNEMMKIAF